MALQNQKVKEELESKYADDRVGSFLGMRVEIIVNYIKLIS